MRTPLLLFLGLAITTGVGAAWVAAQASDGSTAGPDEVTVPVMRIGDGVEYVALSDRPYTPLNGNQPEPLVDGTWAVRSVLTCEVQAGNATVAGSVLRPTVQLDCIQTMPREMRSISVTRTSPPGEPVSRGYMAYRENTRDFLDPSTRDSVRRTSPRYPDGSHTTFDGAEPLLPGLEFQGLHLRVGQKVVPLTSLESYDAWRVGASQWAGGPSGPVVAQILYQANVEGSGWVDKTPAVAVTVTVHVLGADGQEIHTQESILWFSEASPYPLVVDNRVLSSPDAGTERMTLTSHAPGTSTVAWGLVSVTPIHLDRASAEAAGLRDGPLAEEMFGVEDAMRAVDDNALAPPSFASWRQGRPTASMVAAALGHHGPLNQTWFLLYATADGDAHEVKVERTSDLGIRVLDGEAKRVAAFEEVPTDMVTVAGAETLWRSLADEDFAAKSVNLVRWGNYWQRLFGLNLDPCDISLDWHGARPLPQGPDQGTGVGPGDPPIIDFRHLEVGYHDPLHCNEAGTPYQSVVQLDARTGHVLVHYDTYSKATSTSGQFTWATSISDPREVLPQGFRTPSVTVAALTTLGATLALIATYLYPAVKYGATKVGLGLAAYTKLAKDRLLDHRMRDTLLEAIQADPGIKASDLWRRTGAGWGTVVYHLGVLERHGLVSSLIDGRDRCFFPVGAMDWSARGQLALLRHDRARALYDIIQSEPPLHQGALANRVGLSRPATIWHLDRLEQSGLVARIRQGRRVTYVANPPPEVRTATMEVT